MVSRRRSRVRGWFLFLIGLVLIVTQGCARFPIGDLLSTPTSTPTQTSTFTPTPESTPTPTATPTPDASRQTLWVVAIADPTIEAEGLRMLIEGGRVSAADGEVVALLAVILSDAGGNLSWGLFVRWPDETLRLYRLRYLPGGDAQPAEILDKWTGSVVYYWPIAVNAWTAVEKVDTSPEAATATPTAVQPPEVGSP